MTAKNRSPGKKHRGSSSWLKEVKKTSGSPGWKGELLDRVNSYLSGFTGELRNVGVRINQVQIQYESPIASFFSFNPLKVAWVQFRTYGPFKKEEGIRAVRFSGDTAALMVLVRSPKKNGDYDWYLLARSKYQFAAGEHFIEFSRGWTPDAPASEAGWYLFDRDFPGLRGRGKIFHTQLGSSVWENNAEFTSKISYHLVVVTLNEPLTKQEIKKFLVDQRIVKEYEGYPEYKNVKLDEKDLVSEPMVFDLAQAADYLNAHLTSEDPKESLFGENFSLSCWTRFLALCGSKFPDLAPIKCEIPAP